MALASVANLAPQYAFLADDGRKVPVAEVIVGTRITVKAGDLVPIDGSVVSGKSTVDESSLTGEPLPVEKMAGATVWAGTLSLTGVLLYFHSSMYCKLNLSYRAFRFVIFHVVPVKEHNSFWM
jgi:P-type E1-E2 ATPase